MRAIGFAVVRNRPYAGGYTTSHYGRPKTGRHAVQIEINRALYMDETTIEAHRGLPALAEKMTALIAALCAIAPGDLAAR